MGETRVRPKKRQDVLTKAEQTRRTRALIIKTGIKCIAKYGYVGTSMHLISKEAKISRGPLHYHFKDKNDLMGAIAEALPLQTSAKTIARLEAARGIEERLRVVIDIAIEQHLDGHHFVAIDLLAAARHDKALAATVLPHFTEAECRFDLWWQDFAGDLGWSVERLRTFRTVFVAVMRGLALDHTSQTEASHHRNAAEMAKEVLLGYLLPQ